MFIKNEFSSNMLRYKLDTDEKIDALSVNMIKGNNIPEIFIPGIQNDKDETYILIPVAGCTPLKEYLKNAGRISNTAEMLKQLFRVMDTIENYMLNEESIVKDVEYAFVSLDSDGHAQLKLTYIPTFSGNSEPYYRIFDNRSFVRNVISCGCYETEEAEVVISLLNLINSDAYSDEMMLMKINELFPEDMNNKELSTDDLKEHSKTKESIFKRLLAKPKSFFLGTGTADKNGAYEEPEEEIFMPYEVQKPVDICVISVRRTGEEYPLSYGPDIIGTDELICSICFPHCADMEKEHCGVFLKNEKYYIEDYGSKQGTFLNGQRIEPNRPVVLSSADLIAVAGEEMVFSVRKKNSI